MKNTNSLQTEYRLEERASGTEEWHPYSTLKISKEEAVEGLKLFREQFSGRDGVELEFRLVEMIPNILDL
jgi:hypothetical protein